MEFNKGDKVILAKVDVVTINPDLMNNLGKVGVIRNNEFNAEWNDSPIRYLVDFKGKKFWVSEKNLKLARRAKNFTKRTERVYNDYIR